MSRCFRCGSCVDVCPTHGLKPATLFDGIENIGTPKLVGCCNLECLKCTEVCPSGALQKITIDEKKMGTAVLDMERCIRCGRCVNRCPLDAISLINVIDPVVNTNKCNGCALCAVPCPISPTAIYAIPEGANRIRLRSG